MKFTVAGFILFCLIAMTGPYVSAAPWDNQLGRARYLLRIGRYSEARDTYQEVLARYPASKAVDRAIVGIARTHLAEGDYKMGITFLEDVLQTSQDIDSRREARGLYCNLEQVTRAARVRATNEVRRVQAEYDDIPWWNIFKIFKKMRLKKDLRRAEKDLDRIADLHNLFNPQLLLPDAYADEQTESGTETGGVDVAVGDGSSSVNVSLGVSDNGAGLVVDVNDADSGAHVSISASDDTSAGVSVSVTDDTQEDRPLDKQAAYDLLADDIARLIALIPDENEDDTAAVTGGDDDDDSDDDDDDSDDEPAAATGTTTSTESVGGSDNTSDTTGTAAASVASAQATDEETAEVTIIGDPDDAASVSNDEATTTQLSLASTAATSSTTQEEQPASPSETTTSASETVTADIGELRQSYIAAYQNYIKAHQSGNPTQIRDALTAYRQALQDFNQAQAGILGLGTQSESGPAAPSSSSASSNGSPVSSPRMHGLSRNSVISTDRIGRTRRGNRDFTTRSNRGGLRR